MFLPLWPPLWTELRPDILRVVLIGIAVLGIFTGCTRQAQVAARGAQVMPFDLEQTVHLFQRLEDGGRQR